MKALSFHDAAGIFPLMMDKDFDDLVSDIREHGLQTPIDLFEGKVLDGRNRYRACVEAHVEPECCEVTPDDPIQFVLSRNLHRRHLTESQLGMIGSRARKIYEDAAKERQKLSHGRGQKGVAAGPHLNETGKSRDEAGAAVGVGGRTIGRATRVITEGTAELIDAVDHGNISLVKADKITTMPKADQPEAIQEAITNHHKRPEPEAEPEPGKFRGVGVLRAHEAIDALKRIPKNDGLRKRGFQVVTDWIKANR